MLRNCRYLTIIAPLLLLASLRAAEPPLPLEAQSEAILAESLAATGEWSSVHAAEYLIRLNEAPKALAAFQPQAQCKIPQYRIGVWRVLAQAETSPQRRQAFVEQIRSVLLNTNAPDRLHALESLAKLNAPITTPEERRIVEEVAATPADPGRSFALWRLIPSKPTGKDYEPLLEEAASDDEVRRLRAAFVLGQCHPLPQATKAKLEQLLAVEPHDSIAYPFLAIATDPANLPKLADSDNPTHKALAIKELTLRHVDNRLDLTAELAEERPLALRQAAAFAILAQPRNRQANSSR
ncbi:hypothetical protein LOC68_22455 [Blastopirellula sp. JC732]|uniref:HEAT repeat domain-containing protein n=1 Tax=Blastopirellula sediminis TaxID=2894196 RepID=A0A9X1MR65_9BACT|nr:hypothetical protein [Blastopirellula sediminis]MCC9605536.1 hypothetical protein [Blastopirellula sediminis]MCC9631164.1 hypothetical protein [Blastopirellula sediminis]